MSHLNFPNPIPYHEAIDSESSYPLPRRMRQLENYERASIRSRIIIFFANLFFFDCVQEEIIRLAQSPHPLHPTQAFYGRPSSPPFMMPSEYNSPELPAAELPTAPYQPLTSIVPSNCVEDLIIHSHYKNAKSSRNALDKWGGPIEFRPISPSTKKKKILGTPMLNCLQGVGLADPKERVFSLWAAAKKTHIEFKIMVSY